jgi:hypothetical protein
MQQIHASATELSIEAKLKAGSGEVSIAVAPSNSSTASPYRDSGLVQKALRSSAAQRSRFPQAGLYFVGLRENPGVRKNPNRLKCDDPGGVKAPFLLQGRRLASTPGSPRFDREAGLLQGGQRLF